MNQIDVLKNISEYGNPKDRPEVLKYYNQYKNDPTFRNLAISLAESETGYSSLDDSTKNAYKTYKDSLVKQVPTQTQKVEEPKSVVDQITSGLQTGLRTTFPRLSESETPDYSQGITQGLRTEGGNIVRGILDAASLPGRLATGIYQGTTEPGILDVNKFQESVGRTESFNPGVGGFVEDVVRSPYNVVGGVGSMAAKGVGGVTAKLAPELLPAIARMLPQGKIVSPLVAGLGQVARGAGTAADIGITENIAQGNNTLDNLAENLAIGTVLGTIPGMYKYAKGRNTEKIAAGMLPKLEEIGANIPKNRPENLLAGLDQMAQEIGVKLPADQIGKIKAIPAFLENYNAIKGTKYTPGSFSEVLNTFQAPKNQGYGALDLGDLLSLGTLLHPMSPSMSIGALYPAAKLLEKNTPMVEKLTAPIAETISPVQNLFRGILGTDISRKDNQTKR